MTDTPHPDPNARLVSDTIQSWIAARNRMDPHAPLDGCIEYALLSLRECDDLDELAASLADDAGWVLTTEDITHDTRELHAGMVAVPSRMLRRMRKYGDA